MKSGMCARLAFGNCNNTALKTIHNPYLIKTSLISHRFAKDTPTRSRNISHLYEHELLYQGRQILTDRGEELYMFISWQSVWF